MSEILAIYGVSSDDLRLYEQYGLLQPVTIDGALCYSAQDRVRLEIIRKGLKLGFSLADIATLVLGTLVVAAASRSANGFDRFRNFDEIRTLLQRQGFSDAAIDALEAFLKGD